VNGTQAEIRILRVGSRPTDRHPGMGLALLKLCQSDHFVTSFYSFASSTDETFVNHSNTKTTSHYLPFYNPTMPKRRQGLRFWCLQFVRLLAIAWYYLHFMFRARNENPDIVHIHNPMFIGVAMWGRLKGAKTCLTIHGTDFSRLSESSLIRSFLSIVDSVLCVAEKHQKAMRDWFPEKSIHLVSNGVDTKEPLEYSLPLESRNMTILSVGSLRWHKDHATLIDAFAQLAEQYPEWKLVILGEGPKRAELTEQINRLGLADRIALPGVVDRRELFEQLGRASVFILSSVTEGLPKALLEGMAAGCACIATDVGDCRRVLDDNGIIVNVSNAGGITDALATYLDNTELRMDKGRSAQKRSQEFSWKVYRDTHEYIYRNLLKKS